MKLLVTGGRDFNREPIVWAKLDQFHALFNVTELVHGGAAGADTFAKNWAIAHGITHHAEPVPPESWQRLGGRAGNARNSLMLRKYQPEVVVAFNGGSGTLDMVQKSRAAGIPTFMSWAFDWDERLEQFHEQRKAQQQ